ncbi:flagellin [Methylobacterium gregans]|uniref:Flagellin n=1 Tax=Methylobacterium gregans TaxID=374424 RepID=A0AA37HM55_9HYPH|nr:flagellin [Methylobacterium gregans]MDQ0521003.1 flagellin [Methylobacterium gregans]GJD77931.1 hypothetical protein NBEOAGPD_1143 [Methylobacterium gregans]GLS54169.1 flagellin [Methylobacterium gregans]
MTSILTNNSATIALQTLRSINTQLDTTSNRVSTGQRISSAADGAAYWAIASTLKSDNGSLSALKDAMSLDKNSVDAASAGLNKVIDQLKTVSNALVSASTTNTDRAKLQNDIKVALDAIKNYADNTVMNGSNWLSIKSSTSGFTYDKDLVSAFSRKDKSVSISTTTLETGSFVLYDSNTASSTNATLSSALGDIASNASVAPSTGPGVTVAVGSTKSGFMDTKYSITLYNSTTAVSESIKDFDIKSLTSSDTDQSKITGYLKIVDATVQQLLTGASKLGSMSTLLKSQQEFTQQLMDINTSSIGSLVDANIEEESTKLKALQTQQQLGIQSLSIANASSQNVLSLFR